MSAVDLPFEPPSGVRGALLDVWTMARRDLIRTMRQPEYLSFSVVMGVFFLVLFELVFGGVIAAGAGVDYDQYLVPGVLVITAITGALQTGNTLAVDLQYGADKRFRSLPMSRMAVLAGRTVADTIRNAVAVGLVAAVGYAFGFRFTSAGSAAAALALTVGIGYAFSWINAAIAAKVRSAELVGMLSMFWLFPLMFGSNLFTPTVAMPAWVKAFADNQPISVVATAVRALANGSDPGLSVVGSGAWIVGLLVVFVPLSVRLYRRA